MSQDEYRRKQMLDETLRIGFDTPQDISTDYNDLEGSDDYASLINYNEDGEEEEEEGEGDDDSSVISCESFESDNWLDFDIGTGVEPPLAAGSGHGECPICLGEILVMAITSCGHQFCYSCLSEACKQHRDNSLCCPACRLRSFCPMCRQDMEWGRAQESVISPSEILNED